jgi:hypothetical protein
MQFVPYKAFFYNQNKKPEQLGLELKEPIYLGQMVQAESLGSTVGLAKQNNKKKTVLVSKLMHIHFLGQNFCLEIQ